MTGRRGFTLIELIVVLAVISVLAGIAVPRYARVKRRALATQVAGELRAVQSAALAYFSDRQAWPPDAGTGAVPTGFAPYLDPGYSFNRRTGAGNRQGYRLDWDWQRLQSGGGNGQYAAIAFVPATEWADLAPMVHQALGAGSNAMIAGTRVSLVLDGLVR
jgi:prepilin-type N-terminal cleavage/methylation domain-containing protein